MSDKYLVATEAGEFTVNFGDDENQVTTYSGDSAAIQYFKNYLLFNFICGKDGHHIEPDRVDPYDFWAFCQTDTIKIIPDDFNAYTFEQWEKELNESEPATGDEMKQNFDSVDDSQAFALMGEGAQILARLDENSATFFADLGRLKEIIAALGESVSTPAAGPNAAGPEIIATYKNDEHGIEARVAKNMTLSKVQNDDGITFTDTEIVTYSVSLWDTDADKALPDVRVFKDSVKAKKYAQYIADAYDPADYEEEPVAEVSDDSAEVERIINSHGFKSFTKNAAESLAVIFGIDNGTEKGYDRSLFVSGIAGRFKTMARNEGDLFVKLALAWLSVANEANGKPAITARNSVWSLADGFDSYRKYFQKQESAAPVVEPVHTAEDAYKAGYEDYQSGNNQGSIPEWILADGKLMDEYRRGMETAQNDNFVKEINSVQDGLNAIRAISPFLSGMQRKVMQSAMRGEEAQYFIDKAIEVKEIIDTMPETYGQDGKGGEAIAYLHYFTGSMDWYITEKDMEGEGTLQAFGLADIFNDGGEVGYISIAEIVGRGVNAELDLHWTPKTLNQIRGVDDERGSEGKKELTLEDFGSSAEEVKGWSEEQYLEEFNRIQDDNDHAAARILRAKRFGSGEDIQAAFEILVDQDEAGELTPEIAKRATLLDERLYILEARSKKSPLDKFEEEGGEPWQVTKAKWVWIMMGHFETLGQGIDVTEVEDFHKSKVKEALDAGKPVPAEVMADYPEMKAETEEEKQARYSRAEERLNNLVARAAGEVSPEFEADKAWLETVVSGQADMMDGEFSDKLITMIEKYEQGDPAMFTLANKALDKYTEFAMNL